MCRVNIVVIGLNRFEEMGVLKDRVIASRIKCIPNLTT
jgi:hypothetical protein